MKQKVPTVPEFKKILKPLIRFRLRTLLIVMTICCVVFAIWGQIESEERTVLVGSYQVVSKSANRTFVGNCEVCVITQCSKLLKRRLENHKAAVDQCVEKTLKSIVNKKTSDKKSITKQLFTELAQTLRDDLNEIVGSVFLGDKLVGEVLISDYRFVLKKS